jgi:hypothetical protein
MNEEIEHLIHTHEGWVVVQLTEPILESDQQMDWVVAEIRQWRADVSVVRAALSLHRDWARKYRVYGSPCTLVFRHGELCIRASGRFGRQRLHALLERAGLLDSH